MVAIVALGSPELNWVSTMNSTGQKRIISILLNYGAMENADPAEMMAELSAIPGVTALQ